MLSLEMEDFKLRRGQPNIQGQHPRKSGALVPYQRLRLGQRRERTES